MVNIRRNLMPESLNSWKSPYEMKPTRIVVHNTANDASADAEIKYMNKSQSQGGTQVSYHYAVDDKEIVQGLPENRNGWHAGDGGNGKGNREGIAIEICYSKSGGDRFIKAEQNAVDLIVDILKRYGWGIDKVTKHQDYANKYCPHRTLDMGWDRFINMIKKKLEGASNEVKPNINTNSNFLGPKGYFSLGDNHENIGKIAEFMRRVFPNYTSKKALGNYYGPYIKTSITEFQKRAKDEGNYDAEIDGNCGPITLASLVKYGFKY